MIPTLAWMNGFDSSRQSVRRYIILDCRPPGYPMHCTAFLAFIDDPRFRFSQAGVSALPVGIHQYTEMSIYTEESYQFLI